ncbi:MAG: Holliday junction branch migration protein RuvA [Actinobacteria bacterium]|nr:Holliday junction branch migration protein RuvA [Actinomycetota bacterium]
MIDYVQGVLAEKGVEGVVIDVGGVGLTLFVSGSTLQALPAVGDKVRLYGYLHVKEDLLQLYGFASRAERDVFLKLITVTGVGPKVALAVLSAYDPDTFVRLLATEDLEAITSVPGVGKKSGQRMIVELKDKLVPEGLEIVVATGTAGGDMLREAREALKELGYSVQEARRALEGYAADDPSLEDLLRYALKRLGGS